MPPPAKVRRKKKVGRPAFSRKDIPQIFFTYYDEYKYGFWNKQDFAYFVGQGNQSKAACCDKGRKQEIAASI